MRSLVALMIGLGGFALLPSYAAQPCPVDAERQLYSLEYRIRSGQEEDANLAFRAAAQAAAICPDRPVVQAQSSLLLMLIYPSANNPETQKSILELALQSAIRNDRSSVSEPRSVQLQVADGQFVTLALNRYVEKALEEKIAPELGRLAKSGVASNLFVTPSYSECPYALNDQARVRYEANGYVKVFSVAKPEAADRVYDRLKALWRVCEKQTGFLKHAWAEIDQRSARLAVSRALQKVRSGSSAPDAAYDELAEAVEHYRSSLEPLAEALKTDTAKDFSVTVEQLRDLVGLRRETNDWLLRYDEHLSCRAESIHGAKCADLAAL